jgi:hypothetical protein
MVGTGICGTMPEFAGAKKSPFRWAGHGQGDPWTDQKGPGSMPVRSFTAPRRRCLHPRYFSVVLDMDSSESRDATQGNLSLSRQGCWRMLWGEA